MLPSLHDRDLRQRELVPPTRLEQVNALVIGVGAIGRQVALQLAALGVPRLTLYDDDHAAIENLAAQGYWAEDLHQPKVQATAKVCRQILPCIELTLVAERYRRQTVDQPPGSWVAFVCVDSINTRRMLWESLHQKIDLFIDGRMHAEVIRVLAANNRTNPSLYRSTLLPEQQAHTGTCTARSTIYASSIAAGFMVSQLARWLRGLPVVPDQLLNLLSGELIITDDDPRQA